MIEMIKYEWCKLTRSIWWVVAGAPFLTALYFFAVYWRAGERVTGDGNPWSYLYHHFAGGYLGLFLPLTVGLITSHIVIVESAPSKWSLLYTLPQAVGRIFWAKFLISIIAVSISLIILCSLVIMVGMLLSKLRPDLHFQDYSVLSDLAQRPVFLIIASLPIIAFHLSLALRFPRTGWLLGIAFLMSISTIFLHRSELGREFFPWCLPIVLSGYSYYPQQSSGLAYIELSGSTFQDSVPLPLLVSSCFMVISIVIGYNYVQSRKPAQ